MNLFANLFKREGGNETKKAVMGQTHHRPYPLYKYPAAR
jgi:hypothetical protein